MLPSKADAMKAVNKKYPTQVELFAPSRTPDGGGGNKTVPVSRGFAWVEYRKPEVKTEEVNGTVASVLTRELATRYRTDVRKGWKIHDGSRTYEVEHTYNFGRETTILVCREVSR